MQNKSTTKTRRGENSRKRILDATARLIAQSDSSSVTLDQISRACKVSKSSILWHFGNKDELFLEVVDAVFRDLESVFKNRTPPDLPPHEKFKLFLADYGRLLEENPEIPMIFFSFIFNDKFRKKIKHRIRETYAWNRRAFMEQFDISQERATVILAMINGIVIQGNVDPHKVDMKAVFEELTRVMQHLLPTA